MEEAEELPVCVDLGARTQGEAVESFVMPKTIEDRLDSREALAIGRATVFAIITLPHFGGEPVSAGRRQSHSADSEAAKFSMGSLYDGVAPVSRCAARGSRSAGRVGASDCRR